MGFSLEDFNSVMQFAVWISLAPKKSLYPLLTVFSRGIGEQQQQQQLFVGNIHTRYAQTDWLLSWQLTKHTPNLLELFVAYQDEALQPTFGPPTVFFLFEASLNNSLSRYMPLPGPTQPI